MLLRRVAKSKVWHFVAASLILARSDGAQQHRGAGGRHQGNVPSSGDTRATRAAAADLLGTGNPLPQTPARTLVEAERPLLAPLRLPTRHCLRGHAATTPLPTHQKAPSDSGALAPQVLPTPTRLAQPGRPI